MINIELTGHEMSIISTKRSDINDLKSLYGNVYVYFLMHENEIVYIGCSSSVFLRMSQHKAKIFYLEEKVFDSIIMFQYKNKSLGLAVERLFINKYRPKLNGTAYSIKYCTPQHLEALSKQDENHGECGLVVMGKKETTCK